MCSAFTTWPGRPANCFIACAWLVAAAAAAAAAAAPENTGLTAKLSSANAVVGITQITIAGRAGRSHRIVDTATFPDGSVHRFSVQSDSRGVFVDGPFILQQLGIYHDVLTDEATGASATFSFAGTGDFAVAVEPAEVTVIAGAEARFAVTFKSVAGLAGLVNPNAAHVDAVRGAVGSWSVPSVKVPAGGSGSATFTLLTLQDTPIGTYPISFQGINGAVSHSAAPVKLKVTGPPPNAITAAFHPDTPVVGVTESAIIGIASKGEWITDFSTFPDGSTHSFQFKSNGAGAYIDGPFVLKQLGTYHDVLVDGESGGRTAITYRGVGDFQATVDRPIQTIAPGQTAQFLVTFSSLSGFVGTVAPAVTDLSNLSGASAVWTLPSVAVRPGAAASSRLIITTTAATPPGTVRIHARGANGSVIHATPEIVLTVAPR